MDCKLTGKPSRQFFASSVNLLDLKLINIKLNESIDWLLKLIMKKKIWVIFLIQIKLFKLNKKNHDNKYLSHNYWYSINYIYTWVSLTTFNFDMDNQKR